MKVFMKNKLGKNIPCTVIQWFENATVLIEIMDIQREDNGQFYIVPINEISRQRFL